MTTTTVLTPTVSEKSWRAAQRVAAFVVVLVAIAALAFVGGRASVDTHRAPNVAPAAVGSPATVEYSGRCPIGRPC